MADRPDGYRPRADGPPPTEPPPKREAAEPPLCDCDCHKDSDGTTPVQCVCDCRSDAPHENRAPQPDGATRSPYRTVTFTASKQGLAALLKHLETLPETYTPLGETAAAACEALRAALKARAAQPDLNGVIYEMRRELESFQNAAKADRRLQGRLADALEQAAGQYTPPTDKQRNAWIKLALEARRAGGGTDG